MRYFMSMMAAGLLLASSAAFADAPVGHPYQAFAANSCQFAGNCAATFPAISTLGNTLIQRVSCAFNMTGGSVGGAYLQVQNTNPFQTLPVFVYGTVNGITQYGISTDVVLYAADAKVPVITVFGNNAAVTNLSCTISGYY